MSLPPFAPIKTCSIVKLLKKKKKKNEKEKEEEEEEEDKKCFHQREMVSRSRSIRKQYGRECLLLRQFNTLEEMLVSSDLLLLISVKRGAPLNIAPCALYPIAVWLFACDWCFAWFIYQRLWISHRGFHFCPVISCCCCCCCCLVSVDVYGTGWLGVSSSVALHLNDMEMALLEGGGGGGGGGGDRGGGGMAGREWNEMKRFY